VKLLIATRNPHKLREIREVFHLPELELVSLDAFPAAPEVVEDGETFEANAVKKARTLSEATGLRTVADDSGLEVEALGGRPGVHSARYAGEPCSDDANNAKLLQALAAEPNRKACFRCVIALARPGEETRVVEGRCQGWIADAARGDGGFGYDPLFIPDGHEQTFGEMDPADKNRISHRGRALREAARQWVDLFAGS